MFILRNSGVGIEQAGSIMAVCTIPATFYFLYAPLVDFFLKRRFWLLIALTSSAFLCGATIALSPQSHLQLITFLLFASTVASMLTSAATGGLMGSLLKPAAKRRVGAWVQLGSLGANSLFFCLLIFLSQHCGRLPLSVLTATLMMFPGIALCAIHEPERTRPTVGYRSLQREILSDFKQLLFRRQNVPGILLLISPIGSGAIISVLSGLSHEYGATPSQLAFANGWGGGLFAAAGSLCILLLPKLWSRNTPYIFSGAFSGCISLVIGICPLQPRTIIIGLLASNFAAGICYAALTGLVLQTMGDGGVYSGSRYTMLNALANVPVIYMTALESVFAAHLGSRFASLLDGFSGLLIVSAYVCWHWKAEPTSKSGHPQSLEV
jgi:hypothetical protein